MKTSKRDKVTAQEVICALSKRHEEDFFTTEVSTGPHVGEYFRMDALAIKKSWASPCIHVYEVKVNRYDFKNDEKWPAYQAYGNQFSFVCPTGLIDKEELPEEVGLIYYNPETKGLRTVRKAKHFVKNYNPEMLLCIIFSHLDSDRVPFFSKKKDAFEEWRKRKEENKLYGVETAFEISKDLREAHELKKEAEKQFKEIEDLKTFWGEFVKMARESRLLPTGRWYEPSLRDMLKAAKEAFSLDRVMQSHKIHHLKNLIAQAKMVEDVFSEDLKGK